MSKNKKPLKKSDKKRTEELSEEQLETVAGGIALAGAASNPAEAKIMTDSQGDKSSPLLMKACATGVHIKEATITIR